MESVTYALVRLAAISFSEIKNFFAFSHQLLPFNNALSFAKKAFFVLSSSAADSVKCTVPVKCKLTVSTRFSKLDSRVSNVETFEFRDARIEDRESSI